MSCQSRTADFQFVFRCKCLQQIMFYLLSTVWSALPFGHLNWFLTRQFSGFWTIFVTGDDTFQNLVKNNPFDIRLGNVWYRRSLRPILETYREKWYLNSSLCRSCVCTKQETCIWLFWNSSQEVAWTERKPVELESHLVEKCSECM